MNSSEGLCWAMSCQDDGAQFDRTEELDLVVYEQAYGRTPFGGLRHAISRRGRSCSMLSLPP